MARSSQGRAAGSPTRYGRWCWQGLSRLRGGNGVSIRLVCNPDLSANADTYVAEVTYVADIPFARMCELAEPADVDSPPIMSIDRCIELPVDTPLPSDVCNKLRQQRDGQYDRQCYQLVNQ